MSCCASASARHRPTGPAPTTATGSGLVMERTHAAAGPLLGGCGLLDRDHVLDRASPAGVRQVENQAGRALVLRLVERLGRGRAAREVCATGLDHFLLR